MAKHRQKKPTSFEREILELRQEAKAVKPVNALDILHRERAEKAQARLVRVDRVLERGRENLLKRMHTTVKRRRRMHEAARVAEAFRARAYVQNELGWRFEWTHDDTPWDGGDDDYVPEEVLVLTVIDEDGHIRASLSGIADPWHVAGKSGGRSYTYANYLEAEHALEAMAEADVVLPPPAPRPRRRHR